MYRLQEIGQEWEWGGETFGARWKTIDIVVDWTDCAGRGCWGTQIRRIMRGGGCWEHRLDGLCGAVVVGNTDYTDYAETVREITDGNIQKLHGCNLHLCNFCIVYMRLGRSGNGVVRHLGRDGGQ